MPTTAITDTLVDRAPPRPVHIIPRSA